jgi:hypothetical protein
MMQWHLGEITTHAVGGSGFGAERSSETSECHGWSECPVAARTVTHWCCGLLLLSYSTNSMTALSVCACVRACVVCPRCSSLDYQLTAAAGWLRCCSALGALCSSARPPLPCLLPPIYPSSLLKGFSFLFAAHRRAYTFRKSPPHLCVQLSTNKCSPLVPAATVQRDRESAATNLAVYVLQDGCVPVCVCVHLTWL